MDTKQTKENQSDYLLLAFMLGAIIAGYGLFFLGQSWNKDDMALLRSHIRTLSVEQDMPRLRVPAAPPKERNTAVVRRKILNRYYKIEKKPENVPSLPEGEK